MEVFKVSDYIDVEFKEEASSRDLSFLYRNCVLGNEKSLLSNLVEKGAFETILLFTDGDVTRTYISYKDRNIVKRCTSFMNSINSYVKKKYLSNKELKWKGANIDRVFLELGNGCFIIKVFSLCYDEDLGYSENEDVIKVSLDSKQAQGLISILNDIKVDLSIKRLIIESVQKTSPSDVVKDFFSYVGFSVEKPDLYDDPENVKGEEEYECLIAIPSYFLGKQVYSRSV